MGWGGGVGWGVISYDQSCCPASPELLLGLDLGLGCDNKVYDCANQLKCPREAVIYEQLFV